MRLPLVLPKAIEAVALGPIFSGSSFFELTCPVVLTHQNLFVAKHEMTSSRSDSLLIDGGFMMNRVALLACDLLLMACATALALLLRDNLEFSPKRFADLLPYLGWTLAIAVPILTSFGLNRSVWRFSALPDYIRVVGAVTAIVMLAVAVSFIGFRLEGIARSLPILQLSLGILLLIGARALTRLNYLRRQARPRSVSVSLGVNAVENVLVCGLSRVAELYLETVAEFAADRIKIIGLLGRQERHTGRLVQLQPVLGSPEEIAAILRDLEVHGVLVDRIVITTAFERLSFAAQAALLEVERTSTTKLDLFAERIGIDAPAPRRSEESSLSRNRDASFDIDPDQFNQLTARPYWAVKRGIDIAGAILLIAFALPLAVVVAALVVIEMGLPATFWQQRPGYGGRPFKIFKFRTMLAPHDRHGRRVPDEQRVSAIGRFLRRSRLDELPQLYNILVGDMSFVGPRPLLSADQSSVASGRLLVRPGLTGWAQVRGGRQVSMADKAALDIWYVRNASLALDLEILARTLPMLLFGERICPAAITQAWRDLQQPSFKAGHLKRPVRIIALRPQSSSRGRVT